ncbi:MAG: Hsp33 family molecular chaperone HslO, partial [Pseudomonadota bacterium]|nr:Hsp33 family molecular chaperone HslO [Pseudomonadota bacterium]
MCSKDLMHRFLFEETDIRGEIVTLSASYQQIVQNNQGLPSQVQKVLGEFVAAVSLLSSTLKFDGVISLQAR